jgi:hypothetical protein
VELVYLKGLPRSALPPAALDKQLMDEALLGAVVYSLILIPAQIATMWACFRPYVVTSYHSGLLVAGAATGCFFLLAYFGSCYQGYYVERDALHGRANDCISVGGYNDDDNDNDDHDRSTTETELTNAVDDASGDGSNDRVNIILPTTAVFEPWKDPMTKNC